MKYRLINIFLLLFTIGINISVKAQDQPDLRDRADRYFREFQYAKAATIYLQLADREKPYLHDMENLAISYAKMNRYEDAEIWLARVVSHPKSDPANLVSYGRILKANSNYVKAKEIFQKYVKRTGNSKLVANDIAGCDSAQVWIARPTNFQLTNESAVNTDRAEFSAFPLNNDSIAYFVGEPEAKSTKTKKYGWTGNSFLKIFEAKISGDSLSQPELANLDLNKSVFHVGPVISNKAGDIYFITETYSGKNTKKSKFDGRTYRDYSMELYIQAKVYGEWKEPVSFAYNNVKKYSVGHATLSKDEKVLYFVSDMPGGYGGTDIWYCELQKDGSWGKYVNAGKEVNTSGNEFFPFIDENGTLYYSTDGLPGMGGLDIFRVKGEKNKWSEPVNIRYPLNSPADDFGYWSNKNLNAGYISSNRENGKGDDDIYAFKYEKPESLLILSGTAYDKKTLNALPATSVTLFDRNNNIVAKQQTKPDGTFSFELDKNTNYHLQGTKFSYYPDTATVSEKTPGKDSIQVSLYLDPLFVKGKVFRLENIHYDFDKYNIRQDAAVILDKLVQIMHENPTLKIELGSHTDSRGTDEYNQKLSQNRAQSVVDYLVSRGIARDRMVAMGYGESRLLVKCTECTEEQHQENRRTEFTVLEY
ncbi:MAG: OmpA family protein [Paludibacter sp.]|nr:OmpA family protein [Paludibacter sp.]